MKIEVRESRILASYAVMAAIAYLVVAILEITGIKITHDIFGGLALFVISAIYLAGIKETIERSYKGISFIFGGIILSLIFGIMYLFIFLAGILEYAIGEASFPSIRIEIILALFITPLAYYIYRVIK